MLDKKCLGVCQKIAANWFGHHPDCRIRTGPERFGGFCADVGKAGRGTASDDRQPLPAKGIRVEPKKNLY